MKRFFRFPEEIQKNPPGFFFRQIKNFVLQNPAYPKPRIAQTIYELRKENGSEIIVQRASLPKLA
ncbi:MAG: hypothetical protein RML49_01220 [Verrucomicrobiae bacterium]|nr:hypothetical protein [Verrucomicrobiae bacterium]